jgi:hypothetical protein
MVRTSYSTDGNCHGTRDFDVGASAWRIAGRSLWPLWKELADPKTGELVEAYLVITRSHNELISRLHDRMPLIIAPADYGRWLSADAPPVGLLRLQTARAATPSTLPGHLSIRLWRYGAFTSPLPAV